MCVAPIRIVCPGTHKTMGLTTVSLSCTSPTHQKRHLHTNTRRKWLAEKSSPCKHKKKMVGVSCPPKKSSPYTQQPNNMESTRGNNNEPKRGIGLNNNEPKKGCTNNNDNTNETTQMKQQQEQQ